MRLKLQERKRERNKGKKKGTKTSEEKSKGEEGMWVRVRGGAHDMYINQWKVLPPTVPQNYLSYHFFFPFSFFNLKLCPKIILLCLCSIHNIHVM